MPRDDLDPVEPGNRLAVAVRRHVDTLNRQFTNIATGLDNIDATMREIIDSHLNEIVLHDLDNPQLKSR